MMNAKVMIRKRVGMRLRKRRRMKRIMGAFPRYFREIQRVGWMSMVLGKIPVHLGLRRPLLA